MYKVRVLVGGNIYIIRAHDKVGQQYTANGEIINGHNLLDLEPYQVLILARNAEWEWLMNN